MAFKYGFFNAKNLDRVYTAEDFSDYLSNLICNGVLDTYGDNLSISAGSGLNVIIGTGKAWIDGHYFLNDSTYTLNLSHYADASLSRYVLIGISCDVSDSVRECKIEVKQGTAASSPTVPTFENTDSKTYLTLAAVLLMAGTKTISSIKDYRSDEKKCGYVKCILGKCKVSEMLTRIDGYNDTVSTLNSKINALQDRINDLESVTGASGVYLVSVGKCGASIDFALFSNGNVKLTGSGAINNYDVNNHSPFYNKAKSINIPYGITQLGNYLFADCDELETVTLPDSVTAIGDYCFAITESVVSTTRGLKEVSLSVNLKSIGRSAFEHTRLTTMTIPASVTAISAYAFSDCAKLKTVKINSALMGSYMFTHCSALQNVTISKNCKTFGSYMFTYCSSLSTITYEGTIVDWNKILKPDSWITGGDNTYLKKIQCTNGYLSYDTTTKSWKEVKE